MKHLVLCLVVFFISNPTFAQIDSFKLEDYALPELKYGSSSFNANFDLDRDMEIDKNSYEENYNLESTFNINSNQQISWYHYENSPTWQKSRSTYISLFERFNRYSYLHDDTDRGSVRYVLDNRIYFNSTYRYFLRKKRFLESSGNIDTDSGFTRHKRFGFIEPKDDFDYYLGLNFSNDFLFGFGRVEDVTQSWHALRILKELDQSGFLSELPKKEQILDLADHLAVRRFTRYFDGRIRAMEDLEGLDEKIGQLGLAKKRNARYYSTLNDIRIYGAQGTRLAGQSIAFGIVLALDQRLNTQTTVFNIGQYLGGLKVRYNYHKALNLDWQLDFVASALTAYTLKKLYDEDYSGNQNKIVYGTDLDLDIRWFPNTRTILSSGLRFVMNNSGTYGLPILLNNNDQLYTYLSWSNNLYYYLSQRTQISFGLNVSNYFSHSSSDFFEWNSQKYQFQYDLDIGFNYFIY